jgi:fructose-1,6-bisphosphatase/inositol monophosphatase family enzyme
LLFTSGLVQTGKLSPEYENPANSQMTENQHEVMRTFLIGVGEAVCDCALDVLRNQAVESRVQVHAKAGSDIIYAIDHDAEKVIVRMMEEQAAAFGGIVLVAEGIGNEEITTYPPGTSMEEAQWRIIMDPIDGTREIMYDKRPAWLLAAPNRGDNTCLQDIEVAVMVEIPTTRMHLGDSLSAVRGKGATAHRRNLIDGSKESFAPTPFNGTSIRGGFAQIVRFFSPGKEVLSRIEEDMLDILFPDAKEGEILTFEDQYISTGGQFYEIITGKDRFTADIRKVLYGSMQGKMRGGHVCHPYDLSALLVAEESGILITGVDGEPVNSPMDTTLPIDWLAFANKDIFDEVYPVLRGLMEKYGLLVP